MVRGPSGRARAAGRQLSSMRMPDAVRLVEASVDAAGSVVAFTWSVAGSTTEHPELRPRTTLQWRADLRDGRRNNNYTLSILRRLDEPDYVSFFNLQMPKHRIVEPAVSATPRFDGCVVAIDIPIEAFNHWRGGPAEWSASTRWQVGDTDHTCGTDHLLLTEDGAPPGPRTLPVGFPLVAGARDWHYSEVPPAQWTTHLWREPTEVLDELEARLHDAGFETLRNEPTEYDAGLAHYVDRAIGFRRADEAGWVTVTTGSSHDIDPAGLPAVRITVELAS